MNLARIATLAAIACIALPRLGWAEDQPGIVITTNKPLGRSLMTIERPSESSSATPKMQDKRIPPKGVADKSAAEPGAGGNRTSNSNSAAASANQPM